MKVSDDKKNNLSNDINDRNLFLQGSNEQYVLRSNNCTTNVVNHLIKSKILDNSSSENYRPGLFNKFLDSKVSSKIIREPSIINNLKQSFNNISINGKNIKK